MPAASKAAQVGQERYLASPLVVDPEYGKHYTAAHRETEAEGVLHAVERRAECHARALERLTPVVLPDEEIIGRKTRFIRGAPAYCHYACGYVLRELDSLAQEEAQDAVSSVGEGGGIARGKELAAQRDSAFVTFGKKFLIAKSDVPVLRACAEYWRGKCMQDTGDRLWKRHYPQAEYITKGWSSVLFTAAHDPAPDGRCVLDFETALTQGLDAIAADCEARANAEHVTDHASAERVHFWRAAARTLRATVAWARNYGREAARVAALPETSEADRQRLLEIAARCEHVPAKPPRDFSEAVQAFWFIYLAGHLEGANLGYSPGRFDQYMLPFFCADKSLSRERALELLECLRVKMTELEYVASFAWEGLGSGNLFQNMILGGLDEDGRPADNELSLLVLQAAINCRTTQPTLSVWYDPCLSDKFLMKAAECVKTGLGFPAWFNFKTFAAHEAEATGLPLRTIRKYAAMGGCTEPVLGGMSFGVVQAGFINLCKVLELAMHGGKDPRTGLQFEPQTPIPQTAEELTKAFEIHLEVAIRSWTGYWNYAMAAHREVCMLVYTSALTRDCIARGKGLDDGGAVVNCTPTTLSSGLVNVVNSLSAVRMLVDEQKLCTMDELRTVLLANWAGERGAALHEAALRAPKWGNDDDRADTYFVRFFDRYCGIVKKQINYLGQPYDPSMLAISTHAPFGRACLATPDGRNAGQTLADGVTSPYPGTDVSGPFSVLLSASKVDHTKIRGGLHNMKLHPSAVRGARGSRKLLSLIASYFRSTNAFQIQFNIVDSAVLRDAQQHPERYRDLIVRVAGFSAYFVELSRPIQDEVIARTEHDLPGSETAGDHADGAIEVDDDDDDDDTRGAQGAVKGTIFNIQDFALHDGPGVRTTLFLKGCPMRCKWCCNPESQRFEIEDMTPADGGDDKTKSTVGRIVAAAEVVESIRAKSRFLTSDRADSTGEGGVTLSGGEPLAQPAFVRALVALLTRAGIPVAIETSGQWRWDDVADVFPKLSLVYFDIKAGTAATHHATTGVDGLLPAANLARVIRTIGSQRVVVSVPVVHGANDTDEEAAGIATIVLGAGAHRMRLLPYHALGAGKYKRLGREAHTFEPVTQQTLERLKTFFVSKGLECNIVGSASK